MSFLVRKIDKGKWKPHEKLKVADVPADAITSCMRTSANTLSVWQLSFDEKDKIIDEGILAIVTGPKQTQIETIDIILLNHEELKSKELEIIPKEGQTIVKDLVHFHRNISNLTYAKLGIIAEIILKYICTDCVQRRTKSYITGLIIKALKEKRFEFDRLHKHIQETVIARCNKRGVDIENERDTINQRPKRKSR